MSKYFNVVNTVLIDEQAETVGACGGFLLGAAAGAKIGSNTFWWFGPVATPVAVVASILIGGTVGAVGGGNLGKIIASQINA